MDGKLEFLKMVKGVDDPAYLKLKQRYSALMNTEEKIQSERVDLDAVVSAILEKGLDKGIALYDKFKNAAYAG